MQGTTTQNFLLMIFCGFVAACFLWMFRHVVQEAFYESSNEGWRSSLKGSTAETRHR